jgi:hypothetical protein
VIIVTTISTTANRGNGRNKREEMDFTPVFPPGATSRSAYMLERLSRSHQGLEVKCTQSAHFKVATIRTYFNSLWNPQVPARSTGFHHFIPVVMQHFGERE